MREDNPNWFGRWEEELPSPDELMPMSQTLITPHLALAFHIHSPNHHGAKKAAPTFHHHRHQSTPPPAMADFGGDSAELAGSGGDEPARTLKRPRLVWTPQLHKRFVDAVAHLGIKNAVPKTIMQLMSVEGLTRENVASHLQKYRLYLRRMQGLSGGNGSGGGNAGGHVSDPATDHLFASSPVPAHFLSPGRVSTEHFMPSLMPVAVAHQRLQPQQYHQQRQGNSLGKAQNQLQSRHIQKHEHHKYEDLGSGNGDGGRKILTLFPTGND